MTNEDSKVKDYSEFFSIECLGGYEEVMNRGRRR